MSREERSERSRRQVLDAALVLFSHQGYRGTSVREIAEAAGVSTGNLYHHFPDKEAIFRTLLDEYTAIVADPEYPIMRALRTGRFPDNLEQIGFAARDSIRQYRPYMLLFFVDVIEFEGTHIRRFYSDLTQRFARFVAEQKPTEHVVLRLRPGVSAASALQFASRIFFNYFQLEILFGVAEPYGKNSVQMVHEMAEMLRKGIEA